MTATDWMVVVGGIAAIVWVNWYFFLAERGATVVAPDGAAAGDERVIPETKGPVHGGYDPRADDRA